MNNMAYKDKKRKTDHHVIGMADSMPQKSRRSANENRWEMMKFNNTINSVKRT